MDYNYIDYTFEAKESAVALVLKDGVLRFVFTEERYTRKKYDNNFPFHAIVKLSSVIDRGLLLCHDVNDKDRVNFFKIYFPDILIKNPINYYHHLLHCYESFYTSGFDRAAVLVVDGYGNDDGNDVESISLYHKIKRETKLIKKYYKKDSIGCFYGYGCSVLGFKKEQEGHFMGLSSYGIPYKKRYVRFVDGNMEMNYPVEGDENFIEDHNSINCINSLNFAATIQRDTTECLIGLVKYIKDLTGEDNLCLSGGVFNNVLANNAICESGIFKNVWCSPAPGDYGLTVGKVYLTYENSTPDEKLTSKRLKDAYLGEEYTDDMILDFLKKFSIEFNEVGIDEVADLLVNDRVIAWFQSRSEYGRRALGHRSILCNPMYRKNYKRVSKNIKNRAPYRPLACTVPNELFDLLFDVKNKDLTEFMLRGIVIREEMRDKISACCAIDNTTRPQNLRREVNPELYDVIMDFYKKTGIPAVVNTSLNGGGEPIVESLKDLFVFVKDKEDIDFVVLNGKYLVSCEFVRKFSAGMSF